MQGTAMMLTYMNPELTLKWEGIVFRFFLAISLTIFIAFSFFP